ncbi:MAG: MBL fold metallo-hydrolase [Chloroflexi bacterium]|nr:MAG: MBL fold metallo-hydrolase [Chloroflexota bacterium]
MFLRQFQIEGLGHLSALIADEDAGLAAVIDPRRDVDVYLAAAHERDLRITHVVETHLHNDYVSGARELAAITGAEQVIGAGAELAYERRGHDVRDQESFSIGGLRFVALETPGHTPEHVSYAVADTSRAEEPLLLFTGGSLLVGSVGRTDLLGAENAVPYAREMFRSLHEVILRHEDFVGVIPTHGAGSLCSTGISATTSSSVGFERRYNLMLQPIDVETFVRGLLDGQPTFPRYFARMRPTNQGGPPPLGSIPAPRPLALEEVRRSIADGAAVVDARSPVDHALAHIPGSFSMPAGTSFGTWVGWVVEPDRPLVLVLDSVDDWDDLVRQALRVGHDSIAGYLQGGFARWLEAGNPTESNGRLSVEQLARASAGSGPPLVIDVRQASEFAAGHIPGALHLGAGELTDHLAELPRDRPLATMCASGYRSSVAASLLRQAGFTDVSWVAGGVPTWEAAGLPVNRGEPTGVSVTLAG